MINALESGSNSPGAGTFSREMTKTKSLGGGGGGGVVANDWCITCLVLCIPSDILRFC